MRYASALAAVFAAAGCSGEPREDARDAPAGPPVAAASDPKPATTCGDDADLPKGATRDDASATLMVACDGDPKTVAVTPYADGTARVRRRADDHGSIVPVDRPETVALRTGRRGETALVCGDGIEIAVEPGSCIVHASGLFADERATPDGTSRAAASGERFFGLGLHTRGLSLRGKSVELWNTDAYDATAGGFRPDAPSLYESIPFYVAVHDGAAYGVFVDDTHRLTFDMAKTDPGRVSISSKDEDEWIFAGPRVRDVVRRYTRVTGRMPLPAPWAIGFHQSRWEDCTNDAPFCSAASILDVAQRFRDEKIPADGIFLDIQHMRGFRSFTFDGTRFPDPAAFTKALEDKGFAAHVIVDPGIKVDDTWDVYADGVKNGRFLAYDGEVWPGAARFPDFAASDVRTWWSDLVAKEASLGVRGMWIDMNEPSSFQTGTVPDTVPAGATTMAEVHNAYGWLEAKATYEGLAKARPDERPFVLSRAAFAGQQRWSAVWTGDAPSTWTTLAMTLPQLLSLGISGVAFAGSDVGGYSGRSESTADLFTRWMALGSVSPFFRAHAEENARRQEPWAFDAATTAAVRSLIRERYELWPYLYSTFDEAARTGAPVLRPLFFEFDAADPKTFDVDDEAMLGPDVLVAPILGGAATKRDVYLPAGSAWYELRSGARFDGGRTITVSALDRSLPDDALPMFARAGAVIPRIDAPDAIRSRKPGGILRLDVYPGAAKTTSVLYEDDGAAKPAFARRIEMTLDGTRLTLSERPRADRIVVRVVPFDLEVELTGTSADLGFDPAAAPSADVEVPVRVALPAGTPPDTAITIASTANGWTHAALVRGTDDVATGTLKAPRGSFVFFKIARGGWPTVEKSAACAEIADRHALATSRPGAIEVAVAAWADRCN